jgi:hypothetical protein
MELTEYQTEWIATAREFIDWLAAHPEFIPTSSGLNATLWPNDDRSVDVLTKLRHATGTLRVAEDSSTYPRFRASLWGAPGVSVYVRRDAVAPPMAPVRPDWRPEVADLLVVDEAVAS